MKTKKRIGRALLYLGLLLIVVVSLFPIYWVVLSSLKPLGKLLSYPPRFFTLDLTLANYFKLFSFTIFGTFLANSCVVCVCTVLTTICLAVLGAYSLTRFPFRGVNIFANVILFVYMVPPVLLIIPIYLIVVRLHLGNSLFGLTLVYIALALPFCLWLLRAFFQTVPIELEESAFIDGANRTQVMFRIFFPVAFPGIVATSVFAFALSWNDYVFALVLISSQLKRTIPVGLATFVTEYEILWEYILAGSTVAIIPVVLFFAFSQRFLIKGWGAGAVKG
jgi:multiple sugar transport system permease protein